MTRRVIASLLLTALLPAAAVLAAPSGREYRLHPKDVAPDPSYVRRVEPAIVAVRVRSDPAAASSARLGSRRFATGVIFDARGYLVTVSYALTDAVSIEAQMRDGRTIEARLVALDLETGLGVAKLAGDGPWPVARLGDSRDVAGGMLTCTVGVDEDNDLVQITGSVPGFVWSCQPHPGWTRRSPGSINICSPLVVVYALPSPTTTKRMADAVCRCAAARSPGVTTW